MARMVALSAFGLVLALGVVASWLGGPRRLLARSWAPREAWAAAAPVPAAASAKGRPAPKKSPPATRRYLVAAMGDSLTDPKSHGGKYLEHLRKRCPKSRFDSYGVGGNMLNQMRKRFARDVLGEPPDPKNKKPRYTHLIMLGGINDICSDESATRTNDKIQADFSAMFDAARTRDIRIVALTLPPWAGFTRYYNKRRGASTLALNAWLKEEHEQHKVDALLDIYPMLSCGDPEFLCPRYGWPDQVHWSKEGHLVVGKALYQHVFSDCE
jgi:lysophospholipase L1-like esterase